MIASKRGIKKFTFMLLMGLLALGAFEQVMVAASADSQKKSAAPVVVNEAKLLREAKVAMFDKDWLGARQICEGLLEKNPKTEYRAETLFFIARCLEKEGGHKSDAIDQYRYFLDEYPDHPAYAEAARAAVLSLAYEEAQGGNEKARETLTDALRDRDISIRYLAAFRLAELRDRSALPVLKQILELESDADIINRARLSILKIDPAELKDTSQGSAGSDSESPRVLKLQIFETGSDEAAVSVTVPVALASVAINALPAEIKTQLRNEGLDIENIWESVKRLSDGKVLEINGTDVKVILSVD